MAFVDEKTWKAHSDEFGDCVVEATVSRWFGCKGRLSVSIKSNKFHVLCGPIPVRLVDSSGVVVVAGMFHPTEAVLHHHSSSGTCVLQSVGEVGGLVRQWLDGLPEQDNPKVKPDREQEVRPDLTDYNGRYCVHSFDETPEGLQHAKNYIEALQSGAFKTEGHGIEFVAVPDEEPATLEQRVAAIEQAVDSLVNIVDKLARKDAGV